MVQVTDGDSMQELILQAEKRGLLDSIDGLRRLGLGSSPDLPQLIVVGNQCDAKISVIEAIAGARLTTQEYNDNLGCHFVTELVLRTSSQPKVVVEIHTGNLLAFGQTSLDKDDLPRIIHEAKRHWTIGHGSKTPSSEALMHIEISGPDVPQLTLIDLPGFQQQPSAQDSLDMNVTERYMSQENSIVLAVFQAQDKSQTELVEAQRRVMLKAGQHDPSRCRTLGIITEPENVEAGSISEQDYVLLARNQKPALRLARGYHVLYNRARKENDLSKADRDEAERAFFQQPGSAWSTIPPQDREVGSLREKLGRILAAHMQEKLPHLIGSIEKLAKQREQELMALSGPRVFIKDQRKYLTTLTSLFHDLAADAIRGNYSDSFFGGLYDNDNAPAAIIQKRESNLPMGSRVRKLRALIRDANRAFHFVISTNGARRQISWPEGGHHYTCAATPVLRDENVPEPPKHLQPLIAAYKNCNQQSTKLRLADLEGELSQGIVSDDLALRLFIDQAQPWESIAMRHVEIVLEITRWFSEELVTYLPHSAAVNGGCREAGSNVTAEMLTRAYIDPYFERRKQLVVGKLSELLRAYKGKGAYRGNLGGGSGEFLSRVEELKQKKEGVRAHRCCTQRFGGGVGKTKEVVLNMQAYYDMSLSTFVDNVKLLAIENCLINDMPNILTPDMVLDMSDDMVQRVAAKSPRVERMREDLRNQMDKLQKGLQICEKYQPRYSVDLSHIFSKQSINPEDELEIFLKGNEQKTSPTETRGHLAQRLQVDTKTPTRPKVLAELTASPVTMFQGQAGTKLGGYENRKEQPRVYRPYHPLAVQPITNGNTAARKNPPVKRISLFPADTWNDSGFFPQPAHVPTHVPIKPLTKATTFGPRHFGETGIKQNAPFHLVSFNDGGCFTPYNSNASGCGTIDGFKDDGVPVLPHNLLQSEEFFPKDQYSPVQPPPLFDTIIPADGIGCPYPTDGNDKASTVDSIVALRSWKPLGGQNGGPPTSNQIRYRESDLAFWNQMQFLSDGEEKWSLEELRLADYEDGTTAANSEVGEGEYLDGREDVLVIE